jgi:hypothetical protein
LEQKVVHGLHVLGLNKKLILSKLLEF